MTHGKKDDVDRPITSKAGGERHLSHAADQYIEDRDYFRTIMSKLATDPEYLDKYVAVIDKEVVGKSNDRLELQLDIVKRFPNRNPYIGRVYPPMDEP